MKQTPARIENQRELLTEIARQAMLERGLLPDFSPQVLAELDRIHAPAQPDGGLADLRSLLWSSIDNDDSLDLDQLTVGEALPGGAIRLRVAVADVDALVPDGSAIDGHARQNTTSVYTAAMIFPMLPEKLSTGLTSLNPGEDRLAIVVEMAVKEDGTLQSEAVYRARVHNHAKLAYNALAVWLEGDGPPPQAMTVVSGLPENLRLQDEAAQRLRKSRQAHGALSLETIEARPVFEGDTIRELDVETRNRAKELIEDCMVAANGITARFLAAKHFPSIRRVVRVPRRWDRIVDLASEQGYRLPGTPDSKALDEFLASERRADPLRFPDLSLAVIKLLGSGEYIAEGPDGEAPGHFGLAVRDYGHSTAPNRRYSDLVTQRLLKAAVAGRKSPYALDQLDGIARHLTDQEDAANKVERQVGKSAAALLLENRIGQQFDGVVTGAADKGTWVRLFTPPVEGRVVHAFEGMDVGDRVHVELISVDVERGFIDFRGLGRSNRR